MTNQEHPITPPRELTDKWNNLPLSTEEIFVIAAQWGADQELEACCEWLTGQSLHLDGSYLRNARRPQPQPPSDKEQALSALSLIMSRQKGMFDGKPFDTIRKVLEAL